MDAVQYLSIFLLLGAVIATVKHLLFWEKFIELSEKAQPKRDAIFAQLERGEITIEEARSAMIDITNTIMNQLNHKDDLFCDWNYK